MPKSEFDDVAGAVFNVEDVLGHRAIATREGRDMLREQGIHSHIFASSDSEAEMLALLKELAVSDDDYFYDYTTKTLFTRVPFVVFKYS